ncbi:hypothetical protein BCR43DRAFT_559253 [Syncephalastrum racemosum]|uniref:Uncharacterized protein n=1 Tax=Syncephalastrum racemosum TaxID=13706 RepID=A0A1X2HRU3_SYNRA|nr:hypothetical protein BCR43DRAFT_559253 [Syncephalastrum racemosum]
MRQVVEHAGKLKQSEEELPAWLWSRRLSSNVDDYETQIIKAIRFVLTDFASKSVSGTNSERTFWVDRVVPLFQIFGDQTQLLSYEWCEIFCKSHAEDTMDDKGIGRARFVDGMGYDAFHRERLVMESSGDVLKEHTRHRADDAVKQLHSTIAILK